LVAEVERKPWEQMDGEPDAAFARFLVFLNLGPRRTVDAAYRAFVGNRRKASERSGQWGADASRFHWHERASKWDIAQLSLLVPEAAGNIFRAINEVARIALESLKEGKVRPKTWGQLMETVVILASFVSPETIKAVVDNAGVAGSAESKPADGDADETA
jgi:hypothetical protein